ATTSYMVGGRRHHLAAAYVETEQLPAVARAIAAHAATLPEGEIVYVDLYARAAADDELAGALKAALEGVDMPRCVERVVLDVPAPGRGIAAADAITLHRGLDGGWTLDRDLQGIHPEMGERLNLWRM